MFDWLGTIGDFFNMLTSPIDFLLGFLVQSSAEGINFVLGNVFTLMTLSDGFTQISSIHNMLVMIRALVFVMVGGVASWHFLSNLLKVSLGKEGKTFKALIGDVIEFGFRLLSMPFFLYTALATNKIMINAIQGMGINTSKIMSHLGVDKNDPAAFLKRIGKLFTVSVGSQLIKPIIGLAIFIIFLILLFQLIKRSGEVVFLYLMMPVVALSVLTSDLDMYSTWWRQCLSIIGGQTMQAIGVYLTFSTFLSGNGIFAMGILLATISTPQVMKEYAYNSGTSGGIKNTVSAALLAFK